MPSGPVVDISVSFIPDGLSGSVRDEAAGLLAEAFSGPVTDSALDMFPGVHSGPVTDNDLLFSTTADSSGPVTDSDTEFEPPPNVMGPVRDEATNFEEVGLSGPVVDLDAEILTVLPAVIEDPSVIQRDTDRTFLADVNFRAWQNTGDKLTLEVEWQRGGTTGAWSLAVPQTFDRKHDPEDGGIIRPIERRDLQGYYRFEGDSLGSGEIPRDLDVVGTANYVPGLIGSAAEFNGAPGRALQRPADDEAFQFGSTDDFTLMTWVKWNSVTGEQVVIEKFTPPAGPGWSLVKLSDNRLRFHYGGPPGLLVDTVDALAAADSTWHQIVIRRRNRVLKVFWDGAEASLVVDPGDPITLLTPSTSPLRIGSRADTTLNLDGAVDETAIWTRSLSNAEVSASYNAGAGLVLPGTATATPGLEFNFVWDVIKDLPEGEFEDVYVRISVSNNPTTTVIVGPLSISTVSPTTEDAFARNLQRRALADRVAGDFLGCGLTIPFARSSRDFANACGVDLIRSCVRQLLGTRAAVGEFPGDLQWRPDFGNKIWILRHRNNDVLLREEASAFIQEALRFEPRVQTTEVVASVNEQNPNRLDLLVRYRIIDTNTLDNRVILPEFEEVITI